MKQRLLVTAPPTAAAPDAAVETLLRARRRRRRLGFGLLLLLTLGGILLSLSWSSVAIPADQVVRILLGHDAEQTAWERIVLDLRLPRVACALLCGIALGLAGLAMQTVFANPLASPFTLGVSSGASLGVAVVILAAPAQGLAFGALSSPAAGLGTVFGAALGAGAVLALMLAVAARVRDMVVVLLLGVVLAALISALVTLLVFFADAQRTRQFVEWGFGSFSGVRRGQLPLFSAAVAAGTAGIAFAAKAMNALALGEGYARSMGLSVRRARLLILGSASLLAGAVVAYAGPIAFLGIAIPHIARGLFRTADHRALIPATALVAMPITLACGLLAELPASALSLPVNAATALFGAPVAVWVLLRAPRGTAP